MTNLPQSPRSPLDEGCRGRGGRITTREAWIAALEAGEDPAEVFDAETLEGLRKQ